ncbi:extracellular solute-binding protein [bacterium]|nr:extracellular solute-binding protein [bacterium]MCI0604005.1 extracellular solute-binding protein [bacterium]
MRRFIRFAGLIFALCTVFGCSKKDENTRTGDTVVAYVSEDQVFSEPILKDFERETGIKVKPVFDTEETKGTGVMNRLIAEQRNPQCDVYWANEPIRAEFLKQKQITIPYASPVASDIPAVFKEPNNFWIGFSARARVFIVNKEEAQEPQSVLDYTDARWKGKAVIANPLFGTTTVQMAALFSIWGEEKSKDFLQKLKRNGVKISTSNGESADLVSAGEHAFSLVDSDDAINRARQGKPVKMIYPDQDGIGCLLLPNAVMLIRGSPHPDLGKKLIDYLLSKETERKLAFADCAQIPLHRGIETPADVPRIENIRAMQVDYAHLAQKLQEIQPYLKEWVGY